MEVMEAKFLSKELLCKATVRVFAPKRDEQRKLVEMILKNTETLLEALDGVSSLSDPEDALAAFTIVKKMAAAQIAVSLDIAMEELVKV